MKEVFVAASELFQNVSLLDSFIFLIYCIIVAFIYFFVKVYLPQRIEDRKLELEHEQKRTELMADAVSEIRAMIQSNTESLKNFNMAISTLNQTFEKVSDKLFSHDARSAHIDESLKEMRQDIGHLVDRSPSDGSLNRIHTRLDDIGASVADKGDIKMVVDKLDIIQHSVAEIKGKLE